MVRQREQQHHNAGSSAEQETLHDRVWRKKWFQPFDDLDRAGEGDDDREADEQHAGGDGVHGCGAYRRVALQQRLFGIIGIVIDGTCTADLIPRERRLDPGTTGCDFAETDPLALIFDIIDRVSIFDIRQVADRHRTIGLLAPHGARPRMQDAALRRRPRGGAPHIAHFVDDRAGDRGRNGHCEQRHE
jgi:hypothetical protein